IERKLEQLNAIKEDTESVNSSELWPRKKLKLEVRMWLEKVEGIDGERIREFEELTQQRRFHGGLVVDDPQWIGQVLTTTTLSGQEIRACKEEIWQYLMDDEDRKIRV
ncbi:hypothetical protein Goarm_017521, partial [Gossypium armourianum]|nr:hypothetical protein [Gossypium armourianum]